MTHLAAQRVFGFGIVLLGLTLGTGDPHAQVEPPPSRQAEWKVDFEKSLFAVVTHKEGMAAGLAHEHLVVAVAPDITLRYDATNPGTVKATLDAAVENLVVDDREWNRRWQDELLELGLLERPFSNLSERDRRKVRRSMLGTKQLDAEQYPRLRASLDRLRREGTEATARLVLEVRGQAVEQELRFEWPVPADDGSLSISTTASLRFADFGIKAYSALLGAIRVSDAFDVVIRVVAMPSENAEG